MLLGYIGNTPIYDERLVSDKAKARREVRIKELHLEGGVPCLVLVPHKSPYHKGVSGIIYDGLHFPGGVPVTPRKSFFVHFWENGNGLHVEVDTPWTEEPRQIADLSKIRQHHCHAQGCNRDVAPKFLMCRFHWGLVPKAMQDAVWQNYQPGQELGEKQPTGTYLSAADLACKTVAEIEARRAAERAKREAEFEASRRAAEEKRIKKQGGRASKAMFGETP